jgi:hypothetical protein
VAALDFAAETKWGNMIPFMLTNIVGKGLSAVSDRSTYFGPGWRSAEHRAAYVAACRDFGRGGPAARTCGAKLRNGGTCNDFALAGEDRCRRHCGPDAARRFRERQKREFERGEVAPEVWAAAEARRARNALEWAWTRDPRLPGATISLGEAEGAFRDAARALGVDVAGLFPAQRDWLAWKWQRYQRDRKDAAVWQRAVLTDLPRKRAAAEVAVMLADLNIKDGRTREARAAKAAFRAGGVERARQAVAAMREAVALSQRGEEARVGPWAGRKAAGPITRAPVKPWEARQGAGRWKRRLPDQPKAEAAPARPKRPVGRPPRVPDSPAEIAALADVLRAAGAAVQAMYAALPEDQQLPFLRDLAAFTRAPDDARARARWAGWVAAVSGRGG